VPTTLCSRNTGKARLTATAFLLAHFVHVEDVAVDGNLPGSPALRRIAAQQAAKVELEPLARSGGPRCAGASAFPRHAERRRGERIGNACAQWSNGCSSLARSRTTRPSTPVLCQNVDCRGTV
jgi:hypothetical protein